MVPPLPGLPSPSSTNAANIVRSRPRWSETQPKNGRVTPFMTRSSDSAKVSAGSVRPSAETGTSATLKSLAMGASCATTIRPPAATMTNPAYMIQNIPVRTACAGVYSRLVTGSLAAWWTSPPRGALRNSPNARTRTPCRSPKRRKAAW